MKNATVSKGKRSRAGALAIAAGRRARRKEKPPAAAAPPQVERALERLSLAGLVAGARSRKVSVRIDPGVMKAAAKELGLANPSDVVNASLALAASPDRFKVWLRETKDVLPDDFEPAV